MYFGLVKAFANEVATEVILRNVIGKRGCELHRCSMLKSCGGSDGSVSEAHRAELSH